MARWRVKGYGPAKFYVFEIEDDDDWNARDTAINMLQNEEGITIDQVEHVTSCEIESMEKISD